VSGARFSRSMLLDYGYNQDYGFYLQDQIPGNCCPIFLLKPSKLRGQVRYPVTPRHDDDITLYSYYNSVQSTWMKNSCRELDGQNKAQFSFAGLFFPLRLISRVSYEKCTGTAPGYLSIRSRTALRRQKRAAKSELMLSLPGPTI